MLTPVAISAVFRLKKEVATPLLFVVRGEAGKKLAVTPVAFVDEPSVIEAPENTEPPVLVTVTVSSVSSNAPGEVSGIGEAGDAEIVMPAATPPEGEEG